MIVEMFGLVLSFLLKRLKRFGRVVVLFIGF